MLIMSLLSTIILPKLEKELIGLEPEVTQFIVSQLKSLAADVVMWAETKLNVDINRDGKIGAEGDSHA